ncbi:MAG: hypothetical protein H7833_12070 [Magnetococcus sp. DMHC-1]|nr:hypothetical protein [Magnetococcales bacterium]
MKFKTAWGIVQGAEKQLQVCLVDHETRVFKCDVTLNNGKKQRVIAALSATDMALRKTVLPFTHRDQIWAVLPQEAMDTLIYPFENPCYAMQWELVEQGSSVIFALCEQKKIDDLLLGLSATEIKPVGVVMAELGAWPLLEAAGMLTSQTWILIVDATAQPASIYWVKDGLLQELRLVAPATVTQGENAVLEELAWLATDLIARLPDKSTYFKVIALGKTRACWQSLWEAKGIGTYEVPGLDVLGQGLPGWEWVRPAGLALAAARRDHFRLLDFLHGTGDVAWQTWLQPWQKVVTLAAVLFLAWGIQEFLHLTQAKNRYNRLKAETEMVFHEALPQVPVVEPLLQLRQALRQIQATRKEQLSLGSWVSTIQTSIPAETQVKWLQLRYEPEDIQLTGEVPSYKHLDRVRSALLQVSGGREIRTDEARILPETKVVRFRLRVL